MDRSRRGRLVKIRLLSVLKLVNSVIGFAGMGMILYSRWMIRPWCSHIRDSSDSTPPWSISETLYQLPTLLSRTIFSVTFLVHWHLNRLMHHRKLRIKMTAQQQQKRSSSSSVRRTHRADRSAIAKSWHSVHRMPPHLWAVTWSSVIG